MLSAKSITNNHMPIAKKAFAINKDLLTISEIIN
ncbi:MAG: hypothetical protein ACJAUY_001158 [Cognaticolwellia sp.]|jgi:hypothetical protein